MTSYRQDFTSLPMTQSQSVGPATSSPLKSRTLGALLSVQITDSVDQDQRGTCCAVQAPRDGTWNFWLVEAATERVYRTILTKDQIASRSKILKISAEDFIAVVREAFASKTLKSEKKGSKMELSFPGRLLVSSAATSTASIKLELELHLDDDPVCGLLIQFGESHERLQNEVSDLRRKFEDLEAQRSNAGAGMQSFSAGEQHHRTTRANAKKPKIAPHMSVINPRSRVIKPPKGVVFEDEE